MFEPYTEPLGKSELEAFTGSHALMKTGFAVFGWALTNKGQNRFISAVNAIYGSHDQSQRNNSVSVEETVSLRTGG